MNRHYDKQGEMASRYQKKNNPWRPVIQYIVFGFLWVLFSDKLLELMIMDPHTYAKLQTYKGWFFIIGTGILLYHLIRKDNKIIYDLNETLLNTNQALEENELLVDEIYHQSNAAIIIWDIDSIVVEVNDYFTELFGYTSEEIVGQNWYDLMFPASRANDLKAFKERLLIEKRLFNVEGTILTKDGKTLEINWNEALIDYKKDNKQLIVSYGFDRTTEKEQAREIYRLAYIDTLTQLDNKLVFNKVIKELISQQKSFTVYLIGVDHFKHLNEVYGHHIGDLFLIDYANKLKYYLIHSKVFRHNGDQFLIVEQTNNPEAVQLTLDNIQVLSHREWQLEEVLFNSTVSIGITSYPADASSLSDIYRNAEIALYAAKESGKSCCKYYNAAMLEKIEHINFVQLELNKALERNELNLYFQPIYTLSDNKPAYYEVLLRWFSESLPSTNIASVIEIAEKTEQIKDIDQWVTHNLFKLIKNNRYKLSTTKFSINLSTHSFKSGRFIDYLIEKAQENDIEPSNIQFELTEHSLVSDFNNTNTLMKKLKVAGFSLALDDFGTRYSSLNYLSKLPFDTIKIDKSYVDHLLEEDHNAAIIESLIDLSSKLNLSVVAEGIEEQIQFDKLKALGCQYGQGYLMSKAYNFENLMKNL